MCTVFYRYFEDESIKKKYKREHRLGLELLGHGLKELYGLSLPADGLQEQIEKNKYGKPYLKEHPEIHYNISHCSGLIVCGFSGEPVGVDAEKIGVYREEVTKKAFTRSERRLLKKYEGAELAEMFYRLWTLKESRIKQSGMGFSMPLTDVSFSVDKKKEPATVNCSDPSVNFFQFLLSSNHVLSVCAACPADTVNVIHVRLCQERHK